MKRLQFPTPSSTVVVCARFGALISWAYGNTVPTDGGAGYAISCIFQHTDGSAGTVFYVNEGTATSCDFNAYS